MKEKDIIAKHVSIEFDYKTFMKDVNEEDRETICCFFDQIPCIRFSSGTIIWMQDRNPRCCYENMTLESYIKTRAFIEGNWLFRRYVQMKINFYNEYTYQSEEITSGEYKGFIGRKEIPLFKNIKKAK